MSGPLHRIEDAVNQVLCVPSDNERAAPQADLPSHLGGLGIMCATPDVGTVAYLAAAAVRYASLGKALDCFRLLASPGVTCDDGAVA